MYFTTFAAVCTKFFLLALLLQFCSTVIADEAHESSEAGIPGMNVSTATRTNGEQGDLYSLPSYVNLSEHSGTMMAHIILMTVAWVFALPIGMNRL